VIQQLSGAFIGTLSPIPPYDFAKTLRIARYHTVLDVVQDGVYWRALRLGEASLLLRVVSAGTVEQPLLQVYAPLVQGNITKQQALTTAAYLLGIDSDPNPFYALAQTDALLWQSVLPLWGARHVRAATLFEALLTTIIEQQIALTLAQRAERWLAEWGGNFIDFHGQRFYMFPRPEQIGAASLSDLAPLKITGRRVQTMIDLAQKQASGDIDLETYLHLPPAEAHHKLVQLKGVGTWTAAWALMRTQSFYHYMGSGDVALRAAVNGRFFNQPGRADPETVDALFARYGEFAGAAAFHVLMDYALGRYP
jgi:DNA-3-methyladenine glycosylase II